MNDLDQFKQTYITECFELLAEMEERLMTLNVDAPDNEELNAIFRCAHSIKGGAGAFGFDYITSFTHILEALLDSFRDSRVLPSREAVDTLLKARDIVAQMVTAAKEDRRPEAGFGDDVKAMLESFAQGTQKVAAPEEPYGLFDDTSSSNVATAAPPPSQGVWLIDFMPQPSLFESGNEPLLVLRELEHLGECTITLDTSRLPPVDRLDAGLCWLGWHIVIKTDATESALHEVFEFVEDQCNLKITCLTKAAPADLPQTDKVPQSVATPVAVVESPSAAAVVSAKTETAAAPTGGDAQAARFSQTTSIRVDIEKVDRLVNMVGELVITEAMLHAQTRGFAVDKFAGLLRGIDELAQHTRELQEAVMSVRMQPVKSVFSRMPRIVRDISAQLGKNIRLEMSGENTEVDKTVIEHLSDPLMHMIRNSCDHGIETPDVRVDDGKPAMGTIMLSANHRGGRIIIEIKDDGAGINRERVLAKAREKGLISAEVTPSNDEIDNMIFLAGFSTAEKVTNVSGRGVGMDVVKRNIEGMGGTVRVTNKPGRGTVFTVSLPLTLAILDGMIVRVGKEHYIIPITNILETLRPRPEEVRHVEGHSDVINVRGEFVSVIYLYRTFDVPDAQADPCKALVVLVENNQQKIGLVVDELIGQQQVVIKSLAENADPVRGISGATILGDGRVSLILETNELDADLRVNAPPDPLQQAA